MDRSSHFFEGKIKQFITTSTLAAGAIITTTVVFNVFYWLITMIKLTVIGNEKCG